MDCVSCASGKAFMAFPKGSKAQRITSLPMKRRCSLLFVNTIRVNAFLGHQGGPGVPRRAHSGGCFRAEDSRAGASGVAAGGEPAAGLTGQEPLAAGSASQTSGWILLAVPNPSVLWPFRMYWLEEDWLQRRPDALHSMACPSGSLGALLEHCTATEDSWVMGTCVRGGLLALSLFGQPARFAGEGVLVGWC